MRFNSLVYLAFLPTVVLVLWLLPARLRKGWLLSASLLFYASWHWPYLLLLLAATVLNHLGARWICAAAERGRRGAVVIAANLTLLALFKYSDWLLGGINSVVGQSLIPLPRWVLPLGISFYLFECMSYVIDVVRKRERLHSALDFLLFISFFPKLIAGPILRAKEFLPQLEKHQRPTAEQVRSGLREIVVGLFLKTVIADGLSQGIDAGFARAPQTLGTFDAWVLALGFGLQIYFDFSSYSRIAIGSARLCGIELVDNFNHPYIARSPADFWARWHMSLSRWIRDYVFYPMVGKRSTLGAMVRAAIGSMVLCGLWHGAGFGFVLWGVAHGLMVAAFHLVTFRSRGQSVQPQRRSGAALVRQLAGTLLTFAGVSLSWLLFRAPSAGDGLQLLGRALYPIGHLGRALSGTLYLQVALVTVGVWAAPALKPALEKWWAGGPSRSPLGDVLEGLAWGALTAVFLIYMRGQTAFIYFQF